MLHDKNGKGPLRIPPIPLMARVRKERVIWWGAIALMALLTAIGVVLFRSKEPGQELADVVRSAPVPVQEMYAYAAEHPEVLRYMPCYCGCATVGHVSNEDCFIDQRLPDGRVVYDPMGLG